MKEKNLNLKSHEGQRIKVLTLLLGFLLSTPMLRVAAQEVIFEESFGDGLGSFEGHGRVYTGDYGVRLRGSVLEAASLISPTIEIQNGFGTQLSFKETSRGLDTNERLSVEISIGGETFETYEKIVSSSGRTFVNLPGSENFSTVQIRFRLFASSFFETAEIKDLLVETRSGDPSRVFSQPGPHATELVTLTEQCHVTKPVNLTENNPIVLWAGAIGSTPATYSEGHVQWASYGFLVVAPNSPTSISPGAMLACLDALEASPWASSLNTSEVTAAGHSLGASSAIAAMQDERVIASIPIQPITTGFGYDPEWHRNQTGTMLLLAGGADTTASPELNQQPVYLEAGGPVFYATNFDATHYSLVPDLGVFKGISTAFLIALYTDNYDAEVLFSGHLCEMCNAYGWRGLRRNNVLL